MNGILSNPVFVVGASRSGTTLVYSIILSSGQFAIYEAETHLLDICPIIYGNIHKRLNYNTFINDWIISKPFSRSGLDVNIFLEKADQNRSSYIAFLKYYMDSIAISQGKCRWAEQTPAHIFHLNTIINEFPNAKIIHVIRDGRDVALSKRKVGWTGTSSDNPVRQLMHAAISWQDSIKAGIEFSKRKNCHYMEIHYSDLVQNLASTLTRISGFIESKITIKNLDNSNFGSLRKGNTAFREKMKGVSKGALDRWKENLSGNEIIQLNYLIYDTLRECGYSLDEPRSFYAKQLPCSRRWYLTLLPVQHILKKYLKNKTPLRRLSLAQIPVA